MQKKNFFAFNIYHHRIDFKLYFFLGWEFKKASSPIIKSNRALCIVLQKSFPCPSNPNSTKLCDSEYYYWDAIDCGTKTDRLPYICERNIDDIGKHILLF